MVATQPQAVRMATAGVVTRAAQRRHGPFHSGSTGDQLTWAGRALHNGLRYSQVDDVVLHRRIHANNNSHRFPFLTDKGRVNLVREMLRARRGRDGVAPG